MSLSAQKCCVPGCMDSGSGHRTLHLFPNPTKDRKRFNDWVFSIKGDIIGLSHEEIYRLRRVCHAHFEEKFCCRYNRISKNAVPTLNLPGSVVLPNLTLVERRPMRQIKDGTQVIPSTSSAASKDLHMEPSIFSGDITDKLKLYASSKENTDPVLMQSRHNLEESKNYQRPKSNTEFLDPATYQTMDTREPKMVEHTKILDPATYQAMDTQEPNVENHLELNAALIQPMHIQALHRKNESDGTTNLIKGKTSDTECAILSVLDEHNYSVASRNKQLTGKGCHTRKRVKKNVRVTPAEQKLYEKLIQARIKLSKCRNRIRQQSASLKAAKHIASNPAFLKTIENMPSTAKILTLMQFREHKKKEKGRRFNLNEKILALSIFKQAPKGYRFLRKLLILPAPQTLAKLISQANIQPGINKKIFLQLKNVVKYFKKEEKLCVLLFDEMFLKAGLSFNERKDKTVGFVTDGEETRPDFADHAQVFMVRGLMRNYKQPVCYTFSSAATSGQQIAKQIKIIIKELQDAGLIVVATVCDQGTNNRNAIKLLLQETRGEYLRKGQEPKENIIIINNSEIVPLYDPPHLLKCLRNNLITKNLVYTMNGVKKTAKWEHIERLHKENPGYKGVRLIPKLTDSHVIPCKISKMKVKFASQIFSRTVATNMGYLAGKGILPKECSETADAILFFDNLFDSQNGSHNKKKEAHAKPLLGSVTPTSAHHAEWAEAVKKLRDMKFVNKTTGKIENVPTLNNWAWTLEGTEALLKKMEREYNINSVWMRHLNQDPIENFFGIIRSHGCRNTNPTPEKFESAFTTLLINNMSSVHAPVGANCEKDFCENLHALIVSDDSDCKAATTCDLDYLPNIEIEEIEKKNDPRIMGALQYVSGYFIQNAKKKVFKGCKSCAKNVIATEGTEYIKYREYAGRRWLCSPTNAVVKCISAIQDITNTLLKESLDKNHLKELIKTHILMFVEFDFLDCREHKEDIINYLIKLTSRFFIHHYCKEINKILLGKRENNDDEDKYQIKAKKYFKKCCKRPIK